MAKRKIIGFWGILLLLLTLFACNKNSNAVPYKSLADLDSMVYKYPRYVHNRAKQLRVENTTSYKQAYISLLINISAHNFGETLTSDSSINYAVNEFARNPKLLPQNYIRALIYQGIVRNHNGAIDGQAYLPIKQALDLDAEKQVLDIRAKQIANFYLGQIHNQNNNTVTAHGYFKEALKLAEQLNDSSVLFKTYRDFYWNRMKAMDFSTARTLLEDLQSFSALSSEQIRDVKNAEAAFYNSKKNYRNALKIDYELMAQDKLKNDTAALLADYYRISDSYKALGQLDSALHYGEMAIESIVDTTYYLNFHYYLNVAEIAAMKSDWKKSSEAYKEVYRLQNRAIYQQLNTQILELERRHDVAAAENRAIKLKSSNLFLKLSVLIVVLVLILGFLVFRNRMKMQREREKLLFSEKKILEQEKQLAIEHEKQLLLDKELAERKLIEKQFVIPIYRQISQRNLNIKNFLLDLQSNPTISKNENLLKKIETEYKSFIQTTKITDTQFLDDKLFADLTGISIEESKLFNESEKMMMAFIATGADNQQMATLLNTSVESIRVRKSKLKKKMLENEVKIPEDWNDEA